jgi:AcrR family transcriptional regulator
MLKEKHSLIWLEEGYTIFAKEGMDGIQIERLARSVSLNKSSFYHYFGDLEGFYEALILLHEKNVTHFLQDVREVPNFDPGYLQLLIKHKLMIMFQVQILRYKTNHPFHKAGESLDYKINMAVRKVWSDFMFLDEHPDLAMRYYYIVRDMLYIRMNFRDLDYISLRDFMMSARRLLIDLGHQFINEMDKQLCETIER